MSKPPNYVILIGIVATILVLIIIGIYIEEEVSSFERFCMNAKLDIICDESLYLRTT